MFSERDICEMLEMVVSKTTRIAAKILQDLLEF